jgi:glycosyltransferase involved in cell wall biosynthesis
MVSAVVPVHRSEATLAALRARLEAALPREHEVVFVDDASPDGSAGVLARMEAADPRVRMVRHAVNRGQHAAVLTGLDAARGEVAVVLDADGQDPPEAIPALLDRLAAPDRPAAVFALRRGAYSGAGRRLSGRAFRAALRLAAGRRLPPGAGMFFAVRADLARDLVAAAPATGPAPYVVGLIARSGRSLAGVPVERAPAVASSYTGAMRLAVGARALREAVRR